mgnify:FL=1
MEIPVKNIENFLRIDAPCVDVRSPSEYTHGHIPDAINIPLLDDEVRKQVGIAFVQQGRVSAVKIGISLTSYWLPVIIDEMIRVSLDRQLKIYCWRGGMRSAAAAFLARLAGLNPVLLVGGYKSFRRYVHQSFIFPWKFIVIGGMTGSGKTELLFRLAEMHHQVLDLEGLANHKGSVFGGLMQPPQPTTEQFENLIWQQLSSFNPQFPVWVEDESISIGRCFIPKPIFDRMQASPLIFLDIPSEQRAERLAKEYGQANPEELAAMVWKIRKRLGLQQTQTITQLILQYRFKEACLMILQFYDKAYSIGLSRRDPHSIIYLPTLEKIDPDKVLNFVDKIY